MQNYNIAVREWNDQIIFLRKIVPGTADKSYGIQVARLAGLPSEIIQRAKDILDHLEKNNTARPKKGSTKARTGGGQGKQKSRKPVTANEAKPEVDGAPAPSGGDLADSPNGDPAPRRRRLKEARGGDPRADRDDAQGRRRKAR